MEKEKTNKFEFCPCFDEKMEDKNHLKQGMSKCMKGAKWFMLVPGILIVTAFLLGYFLEPSTVRILWLVITGTLIVLGITFYSLMNIWVKSLKNEFRQ